MTQLSLVSALDLKNWGRTDQDVRIALCSTRFHHLSLFTTRFSSTILHMVCRNRCSNLIKREKSWLVERRAWIICGKYVLFFRFYSGKRMKFSPSSCICDLQALFAFERRTRSRLCPSIIKYFATWDYEIRRAIHNFFGNYPCLQQRSLHRHLLRQLEETISGQR